MTTWQQINDRLGATWEQLTEGWRRLYHRASRALTRFSPGRGGRAEADDAGEVTARNTGWGLLACEVFDDPDRVVVRLEAPGLDKDDFDLQVRDGYLVVRGEKRMERERTEGGYRIAECAYGRFERAIPLPAEVNAAGAAASYRRGVLRVELPKVARQRRVKVDVR